MLKNYQPYNKFIFKLCGFALIFWYLMSALAFYFTLPPVDEGVLLSAGRRMYLGDIPYKDFFLYTPPLSALLGNLTLEIFEVYMSQRIVTIIFAFLSIFLYTSYIKKLFKGAEPGLQLLAIVAYVVVTLPIAFVFVHHNVSRFLFIVVLLLLLKIADSTNKHEGDKLSISLALIVFLCGLTNQVSGFYYFIGAFVVCVMTGGLRRALTFSAPITVGVLLFMWWLRHNNMLTEYFDDTLVWVLNNYAKNNTYSLWHEQLYKINNSTNLLIIIELLRNIIIIAGFLIVFNRKLKKRELMIFTFVLLNMITLIQSFNSMNAYYIFSLTMPFILLCYSDRKFMLISLILLMIFQVARSTTYLPRTSIEYIKYGLCDINGSRLICSEQVSDIRKLGNEINESNTKIYTIVGRSPVLYGLLDIVNNTRFDQIFPPFVREKNLNKIVASIGGKCVITDLTDTYLFSSNITKYGSTSERDVGEGVMYGDKKNYIQNASIFKIINANITKSFGHYAISCIPEDSELRGEL